MQTVDRRTSGVAAESEVLVLERREHNAMDGRPDVLANAIIKFAAIPE